MNNSSFTDCLGRLNVVLNEIQTEIKKLSSILTKPEVKNKLAEDIISCMDKILPYPSRIVKLNPTKLSEIEDKIAQIIINSKKSDLNYARITAMRIIALLLDYKLLKEENIE